MMSWVLPQNISPSVTLPVGPSKTYSFSILTQGSWRRRRFNSSRTFENFFSFANSFLRAPSHSLGETTLRFSIPRTVLIFGIQSSFVYRGYFSKFGNAEFMGSHVCASDVHTSICRLNQLGSSRLVVLIATN